MKKFLPAFIGLILLSLCACTQKTIEIATQPPTAIVDVISTSTTLAATQIIITSTPTLPPTLTPEPTSTVIPSASLPTIVYTAMPVSADDDAEIQTALANIPISRQGDLELILHDEQGRPLTGYLIKYQQTNHDFDFGSVIYPEDINIIRAAGINYFDLEMQWQWIQPQENKFTFDFINYWENIEEIKSAGMKTMASATFLLLSEGGRDIPPFWRGLSFDDFQARLYEHVAATVKRFGPSVDVWEGIGEPQFQDRNPLHFTKEEYYQAIGTANKAIRDNDPTAIIEINLGVPCGEISWSSNIEIVQGLLDRNIDFDQLGLQFYNNSYMYNGYYMGRDSLKTLSTCWDTFEKMLEPYGKKMHFTEMSASSDALGSQKGYWGVPWTEDTQAQYLETIYTIFFGKPTNTGLQWYFTIDHPAEDSNSFIVYKGGLVRENGSPKKSYATLQRLIQSWTTSGAGQTGSDGELRFRGFGGEYTLEITNPTTGERMLAQAHVTEQNSNRQTLTFTPNNYLLEQNAKLEKLVRYWETQANPEMIRKGRDYTALVTHHLQASEWALAEQTITAAFEELAITTEFDVPVEKLLNASTDSSVPALDNGRAVLWGATTLYLPYHFPAGEVTIAVEAASQPQAGEYPTLLVGVGANYSQRWSITNETKKTFSFTTPTQGDEQVITIRFPYEGATNDHVSKAGQVGEFKLFIYAVHVTVTSINPPE
jgi:hypothetical protein